jgi:opacity protein-like surface antigen
MKSYLVAPVMLLALGSLAQAQDVPATEISTPTFGFSLPSVEGTLTYSLSAAESFETGYTGGGVDHTTSLSGSLGYLSSSPDKPFSLVYSGGYLNSSIPGYPTSSTFQNLAASQVVTTKNWNFVVDDAVSYLPESPTTGLSGIPGVGDIGVEPVTIGDEPTQSILTNYATRVGNGLNGGATRKINGDFSINGSASWQILHFSGNEGIDSMQETGSVGPTYRIDARSSASANVTYSYTNDKYVGNSYPFESEGVTFQYQRQMSRFFSVNVTAGPQRTFGSGSTASLIPSQITVVGNAGLSYNRRGTNASVSYSRATNSGSGVLYGALTDTIVGTVRRQFSRNWQGALTASYSKSTALAQIAGFDQSYQGTYGGGQVSRRLGRSFSGYFSYTAVTQTENNAGASQAAFSGLSQVFAVGVTYSPGAQHLGHF